MKKTLSITIILICSFLLWDYQEFKVAGGLGFIRNNIGWLLILIVTANFIYQAVKAKTLTLPYYWKLTLVGIFSAILPFTFGSKLSMDVAWLLPFGLLGSWLFFVALLQSKHLSQAPLNILWLIVIITGVEILLGYGYLLHRLAMDYTSGTDFQYPVLALNFKQRNLYASFISTGILASLYLLLNKEHKKTTCQTLKVILISGTFLLFITQSRVGIYSYLIGATLLALSSLKDNGKIVTKLTLALLVTIFSSNYLTSQLYAGEKRDFSRTTSREFLYSTSIKALADKAILGHGLGSFTKAYTEKAGQRILNEQIPLSALQGRPENQSHPHNELLYWGVQGGLISIIGLLLIALSFYLVIVKLNWRRQIGYIALLFPILLHLMVELPFYISTAHLILFIGLLVYILLDSKSITTKTLPSTTTKMGLVSVIGILFICILGLIQNTYSLTKVVRFQTALNPDINELNKAIYPIGWHNELTEVHLRYYANIAAKTNKREPIIEFTRWLESYNEKYPILQNHFNLYYSYLILEQPQKAELVLAQIRSRYRGIEEAEKWLESLETPAN